MVLRDNARLKLEGLEAVPVPVRAPRSRWSRRTTSLLFSRWLSICRQPVPRNGVPTKRTERCPLRSRGCPCHIHGPRRETPPCYLFLWLLASPNFGEKEPTCDRNTYYLTLLCPFIFLDVLGTYNRAPTTCSEGSSTRLAPAPTTLLRTCWEHQMVPLKTALFSEPVGPFEGQVVTAEQERSCRSWS